MIPRQRPGQSLADHQIEMAEWMGTSVADMERCHDPLHRALCGLLGVTSQSLRQADGEMLTGEEQELAGLEEEAVLHCQRWLVKAGGRVPA